MAILASFLYRDRDDASKTMPRRVWVHRIYHGTHAKHPGAAQSFLEGFCDDRQAMRTFAIERVAGDVTLSHKPGDTPTKPDEGEDKDVALAPLDVEDGRTDEQLKADGDDKWPDGSTYTPPGRKS